MEETIQNDIYEIMIKNLSTLNTKINEILTQNSIDNSISKNNNINTNKTQIIFILELQIEDTFKDQQIEILEQLKQNFLSDYYDNLKKTVQDESLRQSLDIQVKLSKCEVPSYEDLNNLKTLERAKIMIINKLENLKIDQINDTEVIEQQIEQMSDYIISIDNQIAQIVSKYEKKSLFDDQHQSHLKQNNQISEYNPMITPLKIDKTFPSFQNSHRIDQNLSQQQIIEPIQKIKQENQINQQLTEQKQQKSLNQIQIENVDKEDLISQSPLLKKDLDEDMDQFINTDNSQIMNKSIMQMQDLDETKLNDCSNLLENDNDDMSQLEKEIIQRYTLSQQQESQDNNTNSSIQNIESQQSKVTIQTKKLNEIEVNTKSREIQGSMKKQSSQVIIDNKQKPKQNTQINKDNKENQRLNNKQTNIPNKQSQRETSKSQTRNQVTNKLSTKPQNTSQVRKTVQTKDTKQQNKMIVQDQQIIQKDNTTTSQTRKPINQQITNKLQRDQSKDPQKSQTRTTSVPKLKLNQLQQNQQNNHNSNILQQSSKNNQESTLFGFNVINNKNLVEVQNPNLNTCLSGLLSPINLKGSDRDMCSKLDALYQSYELKERQAFNSCNILQDKNTQENKVQQNKEQQQNNTKNQVKQQSKIMSLLDYSPLNEESLLNDSQISQQDFTKQTQKTNKRYSLINDMSESNFNSDGQQMKYKFNMDDLFDSHKKCDKININKENDANDSDMVDGNKDTPLRKVNDFFKQLKL